MSVSLNNIQSVDRGEDEKVRNLFKGIKQRVGTFFRLLLSNCLCWNINCDDHSSLSSATTVQI